MRLALIALLSFLPGMPGDDYEAVEFRTLSDFDWTKGMELPAEVKKFDGKKVAISGFIRTEDGSSEGIAEFWLVDQGCDCEGWPKMNEVISCMMPDGEVMSNDDSPITVRGTLEVGACERFE